MAVESVFFRSLYTFVGRAYRGSVVRVSALQAHRSAWVRPSVITNDMQRDSTEYVVSVSDASAVDRRGGKKGNRSGRRNTLFCFPLLDPAPASKAAAVVSRAVYASEGNAALRNRHYYYYYYLGILQSCL